MEKWKWVSLVVWWPVDCGFSPPKLRSEDTNFEFLGFNFNLVVAC